MNIGITGGSGFIGSSLIPKLVKEGHSILILSNKPPQKKFENTEFKECDITNKNQVNSLVKDVDAIIHLAALKSSKDSVEIPHEYNKVNIDGTVNLLEAAKNNGIKKFIFASTSAVYGTLAAPQKESTISFPNNPYGLTKLAGEHYCSAYSENFGLETVSLRIFNTFGPGQELVSIVPAFLNCTIEGTQPIIFGSGDRGRDFIYIDDIADGFVKAFDNSTKANGKAINIGSGKSYSITEVLKKIEELTQTKLDPIKKDNVKGDLENTCADISLAKELIDWTPKTNFEEGLQKTFEWLKSER